MCVFVGHKRGRHCICQRKQNPLYGIISKEPPQCGRSLPGGCASNKVFQIKRSMLIALKMYHVVMTLHYLSLGSFRRRRVHRSPLIMLGSRRVVAVPAPCSDCPFALLPRRLKPSLSFLVPYVSTQCVCFVLWMCVRDCMHQCFVAFAVCEMGF